MIYSAATVPVNPAGEPPLTREQIWKGLELKARDARLFLPPGACTRCEVVDEGDGYIVREATIFGEDLAEIITFEPMAKVSFHQFKGPREGVIVNELIEGADGALQLRFYGLLGLKNVEPGGPEEMQEKAMFDSEDRGYKRALLSTLARTRALVRESKL
ncbi:MAG TPA: SRPBCC family protein [Alphaproteobacteria bacterium]